VTMQSEIPRASTRRRFGRMVVVKTDQHRGRKYRCRCGWTGWTVWGRAAEHALTCEQAAEAAPTSEQERQDPPGDENAEPVV